MKGTSVQNLNSATKRLKPVIHSGLPVLNVSEQIYFMFELYSNRNFDGNTNNLLSQNLTLRQTSWFEKALCQHNV